MVISWTDIAQTAAAIGSAAAAIVALVISVKTLKQNSRMIEEASRPYITISFDSEVISGQDSFFIIKNFGKSSARITKFEYNEILKTTKQRDPVYNEQFDLVKGITLAPGQKKILYYNVAKIPNRPPFDFTIGYTSGKREYSDKFTLDSRNYLHIPQLRAHPEKKQDEMPILIEVMQEILTKMP